MTSTGALARVAVLSDIHGVLPALDAVLAEPDVRTADRIVLTGDILAGPMPVPTMERLIQLGDRVVWVRGNTERELVTAARGGHVPYAISRWAAEQLSADLVALLESLPLTAELDIAGVGRTVFCHATPRDDEEVVVVDSRLERWVEVYDGLDPQVAAVVCGHTHMPFVRLAHGRLVVNPGSVGMPYGRAGAHWALLGEGVGVALRRTVFDVDAAIELIAENSGFAVDPDTEDAYGMPDARSWSRFYLPATVSDAGALERMALRDGRTG